VAEYKQIRDIVQFGDQYRLLNPNEKKGAASMMFVSEDKARSVFYWWKTETFCDQHLPRVTMNGLDSQKQYKVHELNRIDTKPLAFEGRIFSGDFLMNNGLEMPLSHDVDYNKRNDYASRVLYLEEVK
jgi:alpha-galactosidase